MSILFGLPPLLLPQVLQLPTRIQAVDLRVIARDEHLFHASQVWRDIRVEAVGDESPRRVGTRKEVVRASWAVEVAPVGDIVDGAINGQVDGELGVAAVVPPEVGVGQLLGASLSK